MTHNFHDVSQYPAFDNLGRSLLSEVGRRSNFQADVEVVIAKPFFNSEAEAFFEVRRKSSSALVEAGYVSTKGGTFDDLIIVLTAKGAALSRYLCS